MEETEINKQQSKFLDFATETENISKNASNISKKSDETFKHSHYRVIRLKVAMKYLSEINIVLGYLQKKLKQGTINMVYDINLITGFENDYEIQFFQTKLAKIDLTQIRYLQWNISGYFSDSGAVLFGKSLEYFENLYRFNFIINKPSNFANQAGISLGDTLIKLKQLHFLTIYIKTSEQYIFQRIIQSGQDAINKAICGLPQLEIVEYCHLPHTSQLLSKKIASYMRNFFNYIGFPSTLSQFQKEIEPIQNIITHIKFTSHKEFTQNNQEYFSEDIMDEKISENKYFCRLFNLCLQCPYVCSIQHEFNLDNQSKQIDQTLQTYLKIKRNRIIESIVFSQFISPFLTINPKLALVDLYF